MSEFIPRSGSLRFKDENGVWICASPRDPMYSTVTMMATEVWLEEGGWTKIHEDNLDVNRT